MSVEFISPTGESGALDGSTVEKFDALMRGFPEGTPIEPAAGLFLTTGSWSHNEANGFRVKSGWTVLGRGMDQTTVRVVAFPTWPSPISHGVFQMDMYDAGGNVTISDLAIDANWPNLNAAPANATFAVNLVGNNNTIRRVRAIGDHGHRESLTEAFILAIIARHNRVDGWENNVEGLIEECEVLGGTEVDYAIAIALLGGADGMTGSVSGKVRKNTVTGFIGTAAFGIGSGTIFEENTTDGCRQSFYCDVGAFNSSIRRNRVLNGIWPAIHCTPSMGIAHVKNLRIEDNDIELSGSTPHDAGVQLVSPLGRGHLTNITIRNNRFTTKAGTGVCAISAQDVDGLIIENNTIQDGMIVKLDFPDHKNNNMIVRNNRTPSGAIIPGLEDSPTTPNPMETLIDQLETSITAQTALIADISTTISGLRQQLITAQENEIRLTKRIEKLLSDSQANQAALSAATQP